ncbi:hypothetical protein MOI36_004371 [Escherichia coli]|nr:hypothetical protein [Escherichia coli]
MTKQYYLAKNRKQHSPEFYSEDLMLAEHISLAASAREFRMYELNLNPLAM